jgi:hypothetical protein
MGNIYKDLLTLKAKNKPKPADPMAGLQTQAQLAKMQYDAGTAVPNQGDERADLFGAMRKGMGDGPQRGWRAAVAGLLTGLEHGSKSSANEERREMARKMTDTFSHLEGVANAAAERNQEFAKKQQVEEALAPQLEALTQHMGSIPYEDASKAANTMIDKYNEVMGTNYKIDMIDQQSRKVLMSDPKKGDQKIDLYDMFPSIADRQMEQQLERKAIQTQEMQEGRANQQLSINQQNANMMRERLDFSKDPNAQHDVILGKEQAKLVAKKQATLADQNLQMEDVNYKIQDLRDILKKGDVITGDTLAAKAKRIWGQQTGNKAYSDTELYDSISKGLLSYVKGNLAFGNMNQKEFEFLTEQTPGSHKTKAAAEKMLARFEKVIDRQMKRNEGEIGARPSYGTKGQMREEAQRSAAPLSQAAAPSGEMVKMIGPDGTMGAVKAGAKLQGEQAPPQGGNQMVRMVGPDGTMGAVPANRVQDALKAGAKLAN